MTMNNKDKIKVIENIKQNIVYMDCNGIPCIECPFYYTNEHCLCDMIVRNANEQLEKLKELKEKKCDKCGSALNE